MAEEIFKQLSSDHEILSAGTKVLSKNGESRDGQSLKDLPGAENTIICLSEKGINASENTRSQLNQEMVDWADRVIVMAEPDNTPEYLSESPKAIFWEVKDPKGVTLEEHREILAEIESLVKSFIEREEIKLSPIK